MKLLLVHNSYQQFGGEDVVVDQERRLLGSAGHTVATYWRSNWETDDYPGLKRLELAGRSIWASDTRREIVKLLEKEKPDLVHVHNTFVMVSPSIYSACHEAGVPVVQTLHNYRLLCPAATFFRDGHVCEDCIKRTLFEAVKHSCYRDSLAASATVALMLAAHRRLETWGRYVTCFIALSEFARTRFLACGLSPEKFVVKPNFVDPDPGVKENSGREYALFVGRLSPEKRVSTVLGAWSRLKEEVPLLVVGGGPERSRLEQETVSRQLSNVTFRGQYSRQRTLETMQHARFLVFSSEWYENFPMTIVEAFACGVPVICSGLGAMKEIVEDGRTGFWFSPGDPDDLARKVAWAWRHPHQMKAMGREARLEYERKYTAKQNYEMLTGIYEHVLLGSKPSVIS
jgi:glycosyltransferase involved in cell wall biosynthesis